MNSTSVVEFIGGNIDGHKAELEDSLQTIDITYPKGSQFEDIIHTYVRLRSDGNFHHFNVTKNLNWDAQSN